MTCGHLYNQPPSPQPVDPSGNVITIGADPADWPSQYTDPSSGMQYYLGCTCGGATVVGGWNTPEPVTRSQCETLGGGWSPPSGYTLENAPSGALGLCGAPLNEPCNSYYGAAPPNTVVIPYSWITLPPNPPLWDIFIEVDPCDITRSRPDSGYNNAITSLMGGTGVGVGTRRTSDRYDYIRACHDVSNFLESLGCCTLVGYNDRPSTYDDSQPPPSYPTTWEPPPGFPYNWYDWDWPVVIVTPDIWGGGGGDGPGGGPGPGPRPRPDNPYPDGGTDLQVGAWQTIKDYLDTSAQIVGAIGAGVLVGVALLHVAPLFFGGVLVGYTATVLVTVMNDDGVAETFTVTIPINGA